MGKLLNISGQEITQNVPEHDDELGTHLLSMLVGCTLETDDTVHKLRLKFGSRIFETRIPIYEYNETEAKRVWTEMLTNAFSLVEMGVRNKQAIEALSTIK